MRSFTDVKRSNHTNSEVSVNRMFFSGSFLYSGCELLLVLAEELQYRYSSCCYDIAKCVSVGLRIHCYDRLLCKDLSPVFLPLFNYVQN